jgi:SAM-dependent methyltransferase
MIKDGIEIPEKAFRETEARHRKAAALSTGKILDIGFARKPNRHLEGELVVGIDIETPEQHVQLFDDCCRPYTKKIQADFSRIVDYYKPGTFDTINALEFIEHIDRPLEFFKVCSSMIRPGGLLLVSTNTPFYLPNLVGNLFFVGGSSSCTEHLVFHSPRMLNMLAGMNGFETLKVTGATGRYFPLFTSSLLYVYRKKEGTCPKK